MVLEAQPISRSEAQGISIVFLLYFHRISNVLFHGAHRGGYFYYISIVFPLIISRSAACLPQAGEVYFHRISLCYLVP
jgi:hypothetical protein